MSAWLEHVKATMKAHKGKPLKEVLKLAKATYKKGEEVVAKTASVAKYAVTGKKTRKHHKKSHKGKKHHKKSMKGGKKHHKKSHKGSKKHHKKSHKKSHKGGKKHY